MWWLMCLALPVAAHLWKHRQGKPLAWTRHYTQALSRPAWASDVALGMPSELVSWAGLPRHVWAAEVAPSVDIVKSSLEMRSALQPVLPALATMLAGCSPAVVAASVVYHVQLLAGTGMTATEATAHAMMVYHVTGFDEDHAAVVSRFVATHQAAFDVAAPSLMRQYLQTLQQ